MSFLADVVLGVWTGDLPSRTRAQERELELEALLGPSFGKRTCPRIREVPSLRGGWSKVGRRHLSRAAAWREARRRRRRSMRPGSIQLGEQFAVVAERKQRGRRKQDWYVVKRLAGKRRGKC